VALATFGRTAAALRLYLHGLALEDGEVVGRAWSPAARMLTIMHLAWQEVCDSRWSSFVIFLLSRTETEQGLIWSYGFDT
jgi:hypothetical protein